MISPPRSSGVPALRTSAVAASRAGAFPAVQATGGRAAAAEKPPVEPITPPAFRGSAPFLAQLIAARQVSSVEAETGAAAYRLQSAADAPVRRLVSA